MSEVCRPFRWVRWQTRAVYLTALGEGSDTIAADLGRSRRQVAAVIRTSAWQISRAWPHLTLQARKQQSAILRCSANTRIENHEDGTDENCAPLCRDEWERMKPALRRGEEMVRRMPPLRMVTTDDLVPDPHGVGAASSWVARGIGGEAHRDRRGSQSQHALSTAQSGPEAYIRLIMPLRLAELSRQGARRRRMS